MYLGHGLVLRELLFKFKRKDCTHESNLTCERKEMWYNHRNIRPGARSNLVSDVGGETW